MRIAARQALLSLWFAAIAVVLLRSQPSPLAQADSLFSERDRGDSLKQAIFLLEQSLKQDSSSYQTLWRLSKYKYYLSDQENLPNSKIQLLGQAIDYGKRAVERANEQPEGHFWLAVSYGRYAELKGLLTSLWLIKTIRSEFETVFKIDANHENGSVYLALGEMDIRLPWFLGGSTRRGVSRLEDGLRLSPRNAELRRFLGETYIKIGRKKDGKALLLSVLTIDDPNRSPKEIAEIQAGAQYQIDKLR